MSDVSGISAYTNSTTSSTSGGILGKDDFMKLLLTQMKYQDPLNPMESTEFASQLAQFSSLEQLSNLNTNVTASMDTNYILTQSINNTMTAALIGKDVKLSNTEISLSGQTNVGIGVDLPSDAKTVTIKIYNEYGTLVKEIENENLPRGENKLSWDCTDNSGSKITNGVYTYKVEAISNTGSTLTNKSYLYGTIDSIKFTDNGAHLIVNGSEFLLSDILAIMNSQTN